MALERTALLTPSLELRSHMHFVSDSEAAKGAVMGVCVVPQLLAARRYVSRHTFSRMHGLASGCCEAELTA